MIKGLPRWDDPDAYYSQTNNVVESILQKTGANRRLESCWPTSAVMLIDAIGFQDNLKIKTAGWWLPQPEDMLCAWFNDPRNYAEMLSYRHDIDPAEIMGNEVPQWYEPAIKAVFGVPAKLKWGVNKLNIIDCINSGKGCLVTLKNPGHGIAIVAYDNIQDTVIYHDPWPGNPWPAEMIGKPGRCRQTTFTALISNIKDYRLEIG